MPRLSCVLIALTALGVSGAAVAQESERGFEVSVLASSFFGGHSGPTVVFASMHPETRYEDTFGSGFAITAQYFRQIHPVFRWQAGVIYQNWPGEFFEGGEFQNGWEFGAPGEFDDLTLTGVYAGVTAIRRPVSKVRPFASMDLALVNMSAVNVVVAGVSQPYWRSTAKDFMLIKGGIAYEISAKTSVTFLAGFSVMGRPDSVDTLSSGTSAAAWNIGVGFTRSL
jgi:hypothetical protein